MTHVEKIICVDPELSRFDSTIVNSFHKLLQLNPQHSDALTQDQRRWIVQRNNCNTNGLCLLYLMRARSKQLATQLAQSGEPSSQPQRGPLAQLSGVSTQIAATAPSAPASAALAPQEAQRSTQDQSGAAHLAEQSSVSNGTRIAALNFESFSEPEYRQLLQLYMASNADIVENPAFAWENMLTFHIGEGNKQQSSKECFDLMTATRNEFDLNRLVQRANTLLSADLKAARSIDKVRIFRLRQRIRLEDYDNNLGGFPLKRSMAKILGGDVLISRSSHLPNRGYDGPLRSLCAVQPNLMMNNLPGREVLQNYRGTAGIALRVEPQDNINLIPMTQPDAQSFLARQKSGQGGYIQTRDADLEVLLKVGPAVIDPNASGIIAAIIIAARIKDPVSGQVIHRFDIGPTKPGNDSDTSLKREAPLVISADQLALWALRANPELLTDDRARELSRQQIQSEQSCFRALRSSSFNDAKYRASHRMDPEHPFYLFEWRNLRAQRQDFITNALLPIFRSTQADWSFLKKEANYDPRFNHVIDAFIFDEASLAGRDPAFAATELFSSFKEFTLAAAQEPGDYFEANVVLPRLIYDMQAKALRPESGNKTELINLLQPAEFGPYPNTGGSILYRVDSALQQTNSNNNGHSAFPNPGIPYGCSQSSPSQWRRLIGGLMSYNLGNPVAVSLFAFDRQLSLDKISISPAIAEKFSRTFGPAGEGLFARIKFQLQKFETAPEPKGPNQRAAIFSARLDTVSIADKRGNVLVTLKLSEFKPASVASEEQRLAAATAANLAIKQDEDRKRILDLEKMHTQDQIAKKKAADTNQTIADFIKRSDRPTDAFGPELAGLRLGMELDKADAIIRKNMNVKYYSETQMVAAKDRLLNFRRTYVIEDLSKVISIFAYSPAAPNRIAAIVSRSKLPDASITLNDLSGPLAKLYGPQASNFGWYNETWNCKAPSFVDPSLANYWHLDSTGKRIDGYGYAVNDADILKWAGDATNPYIGAPALPNGLLDGYSGALLDKWECGTTLFAKLQSGALILSLHDRLWLDKLFFDTENSRKASTTRAVETLLGK